jgi:hypothetical protein
MAILEKKKRRDMLVSKYNSKYNSPWSEIHKNALFLLITYVSRSVVQLHIGLVGSRHCQDERILKRIDLLDILHGHIGVAIKTTSREHDAVRLQSGFLVGSTTTRRAKEM